MSTASGDDGGGGGFIRRTWAALNRPSTKYSVLVLGVVFFVGGILFWGGFHTGLEMTNTMEFCTTCHEMRENVYAEYKETIHFSNRSGVRAKCSDCHVPHEWGPKMKRKMQASMELWGKLTGYVDTKEKFEKHRMEMATHEWERMKANGSQECRNCHSFDAMSAEYQKQTPYKKHMKAREEGKTCIDCHKGIAHKLPKEYKDPDE
ncbi:NapC/NirT family cytochrome c [Ramlibacter albus]|uniref:Cytochrome c-type protein n=1 Tax=Ramlibacter albus TaxID=2079448 RepID=A0A923M852_9BURK|nr:NapC/NirT family cytochrome c [Ramlibacter albus]MBC5764474.1 NapC/NirT family cytochrome c [Ramlibacter albus]